MISKKRMVLFLLAICIFPRFSALSQSNGQQVSITIVDADQHVIADIKKDAVESDDTTQPAYGADDSVLITMSCAGDVTIGSNVQHSGTSIFEKELARQDGDINFTFRNVRDILEADDLTLVNFEGTLTTADRNPNKKENAFLFRAPPDYVSMLADNGIETVALENNHVMDMGEDGLAETKQTLLEAGVPYASEDEPAILNVKGVKIGSLAYQTFDGRHDELIEKVPRDIQALRNQDCEVVIVSYHWGKEEDYKPNGNQVRLGRATIDAGADLVVGHHSHRINPIEYYNGRYICYSLGNFSFAGNKKPDDMSTFIFQIQFRINEGEVSSEQIKVIPCRISSRTDYNDFAPTPYTKDIDIESVCKTLMSNSRKLEYAVEEYPLAWSSEEK